MIKTVVIKNCKNCDYEIKMADSFLIKVYDSVVNFCELIEYYSLMTTNPNFTNDDMPDAEMKEIDRFTVAGVLDDVKEFYSIDDERALASVFITQTLLCLNWALVTDLTMGVVIPSRRATANSYQMILSHAFGNAGSPYIIGLIKDSIYTKLSHEISSLNAEYYSMQYALIVDVLVAVVGKLNVAKVFFSRFDCLSRDVSEEDSLLTNGFVLIVILLRKSEHFRNCFMEIGQTAFVLRKLILLRSTNVRYCKSGIDRIFMVLWAAL